MNLQKFEEHLCTLDFDTLVSVWNEYCYNSDNGSADSVIYDGVEDIHAQMIMDGFDIARALFFGSVECWSDRVYFDGYGNLQSTWDLENSPIDIHYLAEWLRDENHSLYEEWEEEQLDDLGEFPEWLAANNSVEDLHKLWVEYRGEPICGFTVDQVFNIDVLAQSLADVDDDLYLEWIEEQEDEEA